MMVNDDGLTMADHEPWFNRWLLSIGLVDDDG